MVEIRDVFTIEIIEIHKEYRQRMTSDCWHFHPRCRWWPRDSTAYFVKDDKPFTGELCNECLSKEKRDQAG